MSITERLNSAHIVYGYCHVCGYSPRTDTQEPTYAPLRWWDPDDGWKIGTLCRWCAEEALPRVPSPEDYAQERTNGVADMVDTDLDPIEALLL